MASRKTINFRQRGVNLLSVETSASLEERDLVAEVARVWTSARNDNGIRNEIKISLNEVSANWRQADERSNCGTVDPFRPSFKIVIQEGGPGVFTWPKKNGVGVARCFFRQRCDVQPAKHDVRSFFSIMIGNRVRSLRGSDVHLNSDEVGLVIKIELLDVFVLEINPPISWEVSGKSGEAERR